MAETEQLTNNETYDRRVEERALCGYPDYIEEAECFAETCHAWVSVC